MTENYYREELLWVPKPCKIDNCLKRVFVVAVGVVKPKMFDYLTSLLPNSKLSSIIINLPCNNFFNNNTLNDKNDIHSYKCWKTTRNQCGG